MFKQITALVLLVAFVTQTFGNGLVMLEYYSNTASFAKNCINKARPKMHCNGKCQLMKKMREEDRKDQQMPERKFEKKIEVLYAKSFFCGVIVPGTISIIATPFEMPCSPRNLSFDFFHPPRA